MKLTPRLLQTEHRQPAHGLLLPDDERTALHIAADLHALAPSLFRTQSGWLLTTRKPIQNPPVGYIALQELFPKFFIPVNAQLLPGYLDDEAEGLTKTQQLIVTPGPRFLTTSLNPVPLRSLLRIPELEESEWVALPTPSPLADQLQVLEYFPPPEVLQMETDDLLRKGGMGKEDAGLDGKLPRPPGSSILTHLGAKAAMGMGKLIGGLGKLLGAKKLAGLGANLINKGVEMAPRLSEKLLGMQEAALRSLLHKFQIGDIEEALRRALPIGGDASRGSELYSDDRLPEHKDLRYNYASLFGFGGVRASRWLGGEDDTLNQLALEYRKQAQLAEQRGDHRRATFIYIKLLNDLHSAASVLSRGGLHRDSGLIYLRLKEELRAADQFEKAGLWDQAIELYRRNHRYDLSGILLTKLELHEEALSEYVLGANRFAMFNEDFHRAGKLLEDYAHRSDLAMDYYQRGWKARPLGNATPCALRMAAIYCQRRTHKELQILVEEGLRYFDRSTDNEMAAFFFNGILLETKLKHEETVPREIHDSLRDQVLLHFGSRMEDGRFRDAQGLPRLLLGGKVWTASEQSDSEFAYRRNRKKPKSQAHESIQLLRKLIIPAKDTKPTCVATTENGKHVFVGYTSGEVFRVNLSSGECISVSREIGLHPVAVATNAQGNLLFELTRPIDNVNPWKLLVHTFGSDSFHLTEVINLVHEDAWLSPSLLSGHDEKWYAVYADGPDLNVRQYPQCRDFKYSRNWSRGEILQMALPIEPRTPSGLRLFGFDGFRMYDLYAESETLNVNRSSQIGWGMRFLDKEPAVQPIHFLKQAECYLLAGIGSNGMAFVTRCEANGKSSTLVTTGEEEYSAMCLVDHQTMVATARNGLHWYNFSKNQLKATRIQEMSLGVIDACFHLPGDHAIIVLKGRELQYLPQ